MKKEQKDINPDLQKYLQSSQRVILNQQFCEDNFSKISKLVNKSKAKIIKTQNVQKRQKILKQIQHIKFLDLKVLILIKCQIKNLESLQFIQITNLQYLDLEENNISIVKSLIKCFGVKNPLVEFNLDQNKIVSINQRQWTRRLNLSNKQEITKFKISNYYSKTNNDWFQDFTDLIPFQLVNFSNLKQLDMGKANNRCAKINQPKLQKMLSGIFPNTNIRNTKVVKVTFNRLFGLQITRFDKQSFYEKNVNDNTEIESNTNMSVNNFQQKPNVNSPIKKENNQPNDQKKNNEKNQKAVTTGQQYEELVIDDSYFSNSMTILSQSPVKMVFLKKQFNKLSQKLKTQFSSNKLIIGQPFYSQCFYQKIKESKAKMVQVTSSLIVFIQLLNKEKFKFIKQIRSICFSQLKTLNLSSCCIENLQAIQILDCKKLKYLDLQNNRILNVKSLVKCFGIKNPIVELNLDKNPIISINDRQWMRKINFDQQQKLSKFILTKNQRLEKFSVFQDFTYFIPFQLIQRNQKSFLINLEFSSQNNRISQPKLLQMTKRIFYKDFIKNSSLKAVIFDGLLGIGYKDPKYIS